ncbi:PhzF family phenazine biosynthesis protein [Croceiramulus getboli]|nr:PhzF family phenazine biosynthesis protein [Flavobacteriaceae bacterium YJPT1-3]
MSMLSITTYIIDAFTDQPFHGNPAGVCLLEKPLEESVMQNIARELGYSETAFVRPMEEGRHYSIRYFSPKTEIPLCGHATLASAKALFERDPAQNTLHLITQHHLDLFVGKEEDGMIMEFPRYEAFPREAPKALLQALGIAAIQNSVFCEETQMLLLEIESSLQLRGLTPDFEKLKQSHNAIDGVVVTALSDQVDYDFESRYFWPWSGTNEDPVTGATHTFMAPYWCSKLKKNKLRSFQCSPRGGFMDIELMDGNRLRIKGQAQIVLEGQFCLLL